MSNWQGLKFKVKIFSLPGSFNWFSLNKKSLQYNEYEIGITEDHDRLYDSSKQKKNPPYT